MADKITGTKQAFAAMIARRGVYKQLGVDRSTVSNWRSLLKTDGITLDKMEEMLLKYGARVLHEKEWQLPDNR